MFSTEIKEQSRTVRIVQQGRTKVQQQLILVVQLHRNQGLYLLVEGLCTEIEGLHLGTSF